eukprot:4346051-Heterocapsa_arctica.AAC.1
MSLGKFFTGEMPVHDTTIRPDCHSSQPDATSVSADKLDIAMGSLCLEEESAAGDPYDLPPITLDERLPVPPLPEWLQAKPVEAADSSSAKLHAELDDDDLANELSHLMAKEELAD